MDKGENKGSPYQWDHFSDQPFPIRNKRYKKGIRLRSAPAFLKLLLVNVVTFPFTLLNYFSLPRFNYGIPLNSKIGLCVNADKEVQLSPTLVADLGVRKLSLRIPLSDIENLERYVEFAKSFDSVVEDVEWLFVVLQSREYIDDSELCVKGFNKVFEQLSPLGGSFQIGNAINRTKWGFISVDEYLAFFALAQKVRDKKFHNVELIGSSVIDFEIYALLRSLWHFAAIKYDAVSALLYVDRRGAPENKQFIFDAIGKINFFWSAICLSPKTKNRLIISEVNWPIEHTKPYAPALDDVWVSEEKYANYMLRFYLLALSNGRVDCIYWHQLIAPGYGLIDNREGRIRKRRAYFMFKTLNAFFVDAVICNVAESDDRIDINVTSESVGPFSVCWAKESDVRRKLSVDERAVNAVGEPLLIANEDTIEIGEEPVYILRT